MAAPPATQKPASATAAVPAPPTHHDTWGVYVPGFPGSTAAIDAVERAAGRRADMIMWYVHWGGPWSTFNAADVRAVLDRGSTPLITWMSDDPTAVPQNQYTTKAIAAGRFDEYVTTWATGLRALRRPVLLRFDPEMNGSWVAWAPGANGQTAADYVAAWRHVHAIFVAAGADNVQWVWSPNVAYPGSAPLAPLYPGDAYVDRAGVDGYNWGSSDANHTWQSFAQVFDATLGQVAAITPRPELITEVASTEVGGDKAAWIAAFVAQLRQRTTLTGFVWFDADKETDWRIDSSPRALAAFAAGLATLR